MLDGFVNSEVYQRDKNIVEKERVLEVEKLKSSLIRLIGYIISNAMFFINKIFWKKPAHPEKIIWVDPDKIVRSIEYSNIVKQRRYYLNGIVKGGDWDKGTYTVYHTHQRLFNAFKKRYKEGVSYFETDYFKQRELPESKLKALAKRYKKKYDPIYSHTEKSGFLIPESVFDPVEAFKISISSDGEFLFMTGKHRLAIAKLMAEDFKIPVKVSHRHTDWQKFRDKLYTDLNAGKVQEEDILDMNHPDLLDLIEDQKN